MNYTILKQPNKQNVDNIIYIKLLFFVVFVIINLAFFLIILSSKAHGAGSVEGKEFIRSPNIFYVYAKAGEKVHYSFKSDKDVGHTREETDGIRIYVTNPNGKRSKVCEIETKKVNGKDIPPPKDATCNSKPEGMVADISGVWRIEFLRVMLVDGKKKEVSPNDLLDKTNYGVPKYFDNAFAWSITVKGNGKIEKKGRVWAEVYLMMQRAENHDPYYFDHVTDLPRWYVNEQGYIYKSTYHKYMGVDSIFLVSSHGIVDNGTDCNIQYKSISGYDANYDSLWSDIKKCSELYKIFFEEPANDLPEIATFWGHHDSWVKPQIKTPTVTIDGYSQSMPNSGKPEGTLNYTVNNYVGNVNIKITVNNNKGVVKTYDYIDNAKAGSNSFNFTNNDVTGDHLTINAEVVVNKVGSIHFVNADAEVRSGISIERLNGSLTNRNTIYWDDSGLQKSKRCSETSPKSALPQNGFGSNGVHGWSNKSPCGQYTYGNYLGEPGDTDLDDLGSWGNNRYIHDWTYDPDATVVDSESFTFIIKKYPYFHVYGNDVIAGLPFHKSDGTCSSKNTDAHIEARTIKIGDTYAGSGGQFAVSAAGDIKDFYSASMHNTNRASTNSKPPLDISMGNVDSLGAPALYGNAGKDQTGFYGCITDYEKYGKNKEVVAGNQIISSEADALGKSDKLIEGNLTISGNTNPNSTDYNDLDDLKAKRKLIIVKGNIYIKPNVSVLDGVYIAIPDDDGNGGEIHTCYVDDTNAGKRPCLSQLRINGAFIAKKVYFERLVNDVADDAAPDELADNSKAAEVFNLTPDILLMYSMSKEDLGSINFKGKYDHIVGLPPIL